MDWVKIGSAIGNGIKHILESASEERQRFEQRATQAISKAQNLSDEELERKVRNAYENGKDDLESRALYTEYRDRN